MKVKLKDCLPWILDWDTLITGWGEFMTKELIRERCVDCIQKALCLRVVDLLNNGKAEEAWEALIG